MKILKIVGYSALLVAAILTGTVFCAEDVALKFDERVWEVGYSGKNDDQGIAEFVIKGESVENWSELVTLQVFFGLQLKVTPEEFMDNMISGILKAAPEAKWSVIERNESDVIFEWQIERVPGQDDQYEIDRVISGKEALHVIHYATKKLPVPEQVRSEWINNLRASELRYR